MSSEVRLNTHARVLLPTLPATVPADDAGRCGGFRETISGTDATDGWATVNVTRRIPNALSSEADGLDVGSHTIVLGNSGSSLSFAQNRDLVPGRLIAPGDERAGALDPTPLQVLVERGRHR